MVDFRNKELIKVMWLPEEAEILFDVKKEISIPITSELYGCLLNFINVDDWKQTYRSGYHDWLDEDDNSIYDIHNEVNLKMVNALLELNAILTDKMFFYWFDIDRTFNVQFEWKICPLSKKPLISLGEEYPQHNSLISPDYPLIFPGN